jgi:hypothetical protein
MDSESLPAAVSEPAPTCQVPSAPTPSGPTVADLIVYLSELPRLLEAGHAGRHALVMGDEVISVWDTQRDVLQAGYERFGFGQFTVKKIDPRDPGRLAAIQSKERPPCPS